MRIWLDDFRDAPMGDWGVIRSYKDFVFYIKHRGVPEHIDFDHDLGACEDCTNKFLHIGDMETPETAFVNYCPHAKTGYDCALYLVENDLLIKSWSVVCFWRVYFKYWGALDGDEMTRQEWQSKYQITEEEMRIIELVLSIYKGKIVGIKERK